MFLCSRNLFVKKINKLKIVLITSFHYTTYYPPGMRRRSDVSVRHHIGRNVADHAETSSRRRNRYVNEADLFGTSFRRLIGGVEKTDLFEAS